MLHARSDYDPIQDPTGKIPEDEPVFLIRGQDPAGPMTLDFYRDAAERLGASAEVIVKTGAQANAMRKWQRDHPESVHPADL